MSPPPPNYEFQEWWNREREKTLGSTTTGGGGTGLFDKSETPNWSTVEIQSPSSRTSDLTVEKERSRNARQRSYVFLLKFQQSAQFLAWLTNSTFSLFLTANRRISSSNPNSNRSESRLYRIIKAFSILAVILLLFELIAFFKGWHFSPPSSASAEFSGLIEFLYANWLFVRANFLAPPLQALANVCIVLFLIQSVDRILLVFGCFWIKFRGLKPVPLAEFGEDIENSNPNDYPMVLLQIPMCNEREAAEDDSNAKRSKPSEDTVIGKDAAKPKFEQNGSASGGDGGQKETKDNSRPPEPPKQDYIHVRARRGQATYSHSLAERVRREKISERMKFLQDLVPGCNKITGKAVMLDEIINYVQSLQRQVEFLSMKLSTVNPRLDFNMETLLSKDAAEDDSNAKRSKPSEDTVIGKDAAKPKFEQNGSASGGDGGQKETKDNSRPPEPPKQDYIHVRARRGQATDSHSLAERVRREKISERMKFLQDLVPGCNKITGKAVMLDEIINYIQSLQRQVEFLSMKLSTVNPRLDFNMETLLSKDILQSRGSVPQMVFPLDSSVSAFSFNHQPQQGPLQSVVSNGSETQCSVNPSDATLRRTLGMQLPTVDGYGNTSSQLAAFWEDDLQSVVQMGFGQNQETIFTSQTFPGSLPTAHMKIEI
ncbi:uncharacterized protein LOC143860449 isoform X1 [Tasmannia lanceolata]|uniref:uncharacterized protein LOC143860449 isoform X1 n=1 Tax=Tasmannia lanceolata TaxID=3420 RepID=UPI00406464E6